VLSSLLLALAAPSVQVEEVRAIFAAKCVECHSPESTDRRAKRYPANALDLESVVEEFVVAGEPDDSELWFQVADAYMPPEESEIAPLNAEELESVRAWILAGAPTKEEPPASEQAAPAGAAQPARTAARSFGKRLRVLIGRLHPLVVHFPIAFVLAAALAELLNARRRDARLRFVTTFMLRLACVGALAATALGLVRALEERSGASDLEWHRWLGIGAALAQTLCWLLAERVQRNDSPAKLRAFRAVLLLAVAATCAAGHFGGLLTYGPNYWSF